MAVGLKAAAVGLAGMARPGSRAVAVLDTAEAASAGRLCSATKMRAKNGMRLQDGNAFLFTIIQGWAKPLALHKGH